VLREPLLLCAVVLFFEPDPELLLDELLLDLLLLDAPREDDVLAPEEREELLFLDLPLDFEGIENPLSIILCDETASCAGCQACHEISSHSLCAQSLWLDR
jgi:hypothetical protein